VPRLTRPERRGLAHAACSGLAVPTVAWHPSGRPGLRPHNRLL